MNRTNLHLAAAFATALTVFGVDASLSPSRAPRQAAFFQTSAELGRVIAAQGNRALREIRADLLRDFHAQPLPPLPAHEADDSEHALADASI